MKKSILLISCILLLSWVNGQNITDVVRYGTENTQGTARFQALGGAFGALGGDMSAVGINPAGSAVFVNSKTTFSGTRYVFDNTTSYSGTEENMNTNNIGFNQVGGVFVFKTRNRKAKWKKLALSINRDQANNFDDKFSTFGKSTISIDRYFLGFANGIRFGQILPVPGESLQEAYINIGTEFGFPHQQAFLGYHAFIINADDDSNPNTTNYVSRVGNFTSLDHQYQLEADGQNNKLTLNIATQYDMIYFGASVNFHTIQYNRLTQFSESGYDPASSLQYVNFDTLLSTSGRGFSFALGAIAKIKKILRLGVTYQSPIQYTLSEEFSQSVRSNSAFPSFASIGFNIVNVFPEYKLEIPAKYTGSIALVFAKHGLISFDYDYQDFATARLKPESDPLFRDQNILISNRLKEIHTFRVGGEYRIKKLYLRGGYQLNKSPYVNEISLGDLQGYSFGLGYDFGGTQIDVSFRQFERLKKHQLFDQGFPNLTDINAKNQNITVSLSVSL